MRIYIKTSKSVKFWVPVPIWIFKLATGVWVEGIIKKNVPRKYRPYVDSIDFLKLHEAINVLKQYKGLVIADIRAKDGTVVNIRL